MEPEYQPSPTEISTDHPKTRIWFYLICGLLVGAILITAITYIVKTEKTKQPDTAIYTTEQPPPTEWKPEKPRKNISPTIPTVWQTYTDHYRGFTIRHPTTWKIEQDPIKWFNQNDLDLILSLVKKHNTILRILFRFMPVLILGLHNST